MAEVQRLPLDLSDHGVYGAEMEPHEIHREAVTLASKFLALIIMARNSKLIQDGNRSFLHAILKTVCGMLT